MLRRNNSSGLAYSYIFTLFSLAIIHLPMGGCRLNLENGLDAKIEEKLRFKDIRVNIVNED